MTLPTLMFPQGDHASMQVFIPKETSGLATLLRNLKSIGVNEIKEDLKRPGNCEKVRLHLPKFKIESTMNLAQPLQNVSSVRKTRHDDTVKCY